VRQVVEAETVGDESEEDIQVRITTDLASNPDPSDTLIIIQNTLKKLANSA